jgi:hypothetical protein
MGFEKIPFVEAMPFETAWRGDSEKESRELSQKGGT